MCQIRATGTWNARKILSMGKVVEDLGGWNKMVDRRGHFSIRLAYNILLGDIMKVDRRSISMCTTTSPRAIFIVWLA